MNNLKIKGFKAFKDEVEIRLDEKNLLLYGENGAGKSSIFEAIKLTFFRDRLLSHLTASTPEDEEQLKADFLSGFNNKIDNTSFYVNVNGDNYDSFQSDNYQVFMLSSQEISTIDKINLKDLLDNSFFKIEDLHNLEIEFFNLIQEEVNERLKDFNESVRIEIDEEDNYNFKIIDPTKSISYKSDLRKYFNEAKINLILILTLLTVFRLYRKDDSSTKRILVLDDFITSLDSSNRSFIIEYLFRYFGNTQVLILTHNITFYNLVMFRIKLHKLESKWNFANVYEIGHCHRIYLKAEIERAKSISDAYTNLANAISPIDIDSIGNRIRKKFEVLLYEYSKLLMIGAVEDSKKIIERIMHGQSAYFKGKNSTASDLVDEIDEIISDPQINNYCQKVKDKIAEFKLNEFSNFQATIKDLRLYQKLTLHTLSHGVEGMPSFTTKEIEQSLVLLQKFEDVLKGMVDDNIAVI